jgi:uncharacterized delta-60 repeat protein
MRALFVVLLVLVAAVALGCGDDDDGSSDGDGGTGGPGGASASSGSGGQSGSGTSGGSSGSGTSGGGSGSGGQSGSGGMAGSAAAAAGSDAGGGAGSGIVDGSLDPTFGVDGIALLDLKESEQFAGVAIQPSGKILAVGVVGGQACIARYTREGALDPSFGDMGLALAEISDTTSAFSKVDQQSDGSLIAVGQSGNATGDMFVARFSAEGQLDGSFGTDGFTVIDTGGDDGLTELIVLPDDTILIGGYATPAATGTDFAVAHLDADGIPDPNFGSGGLACAHYDQSDRALGMGRDSQGRIVVGGGVAPDSNSDNKSVGFARFTATGVLDSSFGNNGWTVVPKAGATRDIVEDLIILSGDEILATGCLDGEPGLIRLTSTGEVDAGFGLSGRAHAGFSGRGRALIREAGSTLVVGYDATYDDTLAVVARFTDAGDLDPSLAGAGVRTYDLGTGHAWFADAARQEDGRLVAVGMAEGETLDGVLVRLDVR